MSRAVALHAVATCLPGTELIQDHILLRVSSLVRTDTFSERGGKWCGAWSCLHSTRSKVGRQAVATGALPKTASHLDGRKLSSPFLRTGLPGRAKPPLERHCF